MSDTLGYAIQTKIGEIAATSVLKLYCKYLVMSGKTKTKEASVEALGPVCSKALDNGSISQSAINSVIKHLEKNPLFLKTVKANNHQSTFVDKAIMNSIMHADTDLLQGEDAQLFSEAKEVMERAVELRNKIAKKYGDLFLGEAAKFYSDYKNLFDPGFEPIVREAIAGEKSVNLGIELPKH